MSDEQVRTSEDEVEAHGLDVTDDVTDDVAGAHSDEPDVEGHGFRMDVTDDVTEDVTD